MDIGGPADGRGVRLSVDMFLQVEHAVYIALGALLSITALLALGSAALLLWDGVRDWAGTSAIFLVIDRLLLVLMLIEILHTVRVSIRSGALTCEPFLIVGLIASIRRVLVITLESSAVNRPGTVPDNGALFRSSMMELGVLGALILIMVLSIYLLRRSSGHDTGDRADGI